MSSDHTALYCHKNILSIASPFFSDMFSLGQHGTHIDDMKLEDGTPIIPVTESGKLLQSLLSIVYPVPTPRKYNLKDTAELLEAARKYDIEVVKDQMDAQLKTHIQAEPLKVFAIACRLDMEKEAMLAAQRLRKTDEEKRPAMCYTSEMDKISAGCYFRLLKFLHEDGEVDEDFSFTRPIRRRPETQDTESEYVDETYPEWIATGLFDEHSEDVILRSTDSVLFPAHRLVLSLASSELSSIIKVAVTPKDSDIAIADVPVDTETLHQMLRCCYGLVPSVRDEERTFALMDVFMKYDLTRAINLLRIMVQPLLVSNPVRAYLVAITLGWDDEARTAAKHAASIDIQHTYVPEMENSSAAAYRNLLKYHMKCQAVRRHIASRFSTRQLSSHRYLPSGSAFGVLNMSKPIRSHGKLNAVIVDREVHGAKFEALLEESNDMDAALESEMSKACGHFLYLFYL